MFSAVVLHAQNTITGTITDKNGEVLIGVTIYETGNSANGTTTDLDGSYNIRDLCNSYK